jgi:hypothetical protein
VTAAGIMAYLSGLGNVKVMATFGKIRRFTTGFTTPLLTSQLVIT